MMSKTKIIIADDHLMFRTAIAGFLNRQEDLVVVGEASDGKEIIELSRSISADIILMDVGLPGICGVKATQQIIDSHPKSKILALSSYNNEDHIVKMVQSGAIGYILKNSSVHELLRAIHTIREGNSYFSKIVSSKLFAKLDNKKPITHSRKKQLNGVSITLREYEILKFVVEELSNKEIADILYISPRTVETHKRNLIKKLNVKNTIGLVKYYLKVTTDKIEQSIPQTTGLTY